MAERKVLAMGTYLPSLDNFVLGNLSFQGMGMMVEKKIHLSELLDGIFSEMLKSSLFFGSERVCSSYRDFAPNLVCSSKQIIISGQQDSAFHPTL